MRYAKNIDTKIPSTTLNGTDIKKKLNCQENRREGGGEECRGGWREGVRGARGKRGKGGSGRKEGRKRGDININTQHTVEYRVMGGGGGGVNDGTDGKNALISFLRNATIAISFARSRVRFNGVKCIFTFDNVCVCEPEHVVCVRKSASKSKLCYEYINYKFNVNK